MAEREPDAILNYKTGECQILHKPPLDWLCKVIYEPYALQMIEKEAEEKNPNPDNLLSNV